MYTTRSSTKRTADKAEQPTVPPQLEDVGNMEDLGSVEGAEDVGEDAPSVSLSKLTTSQN